MCVNLIVSLLKSNFIVFFSLDDKKTFVRIWKMMKINLRVYVSEICRLYNIEIIYDSCVARSITRTFGIMICIRHTFNLFFSHKKFFWIDSLVEVRSVVIEVNQVVIFFSYMIHSIGYHLLSSRSNLNGFIFRYKKKSVKRKLKKNLQRYCMNDEE